MATELKKVQQIKFRIQDKEYIVAPEDVSPSTTLNSYIRDTLKLTGTKGLCYEGGCGSCVVVIYSRDPVTQKDIYLSINSCLVPLLSCDGWQIYTIETIGNPVDGYHPVQEALATFNGTQCGFCSPGMVMNMYALYESGQLTMDQVENSFGGNVCRCTGYRPILSAFKSLCTDASSEILGHYPDIEDLRVCKKNKCESRCAGSCERVVKEPFYHQLADDTTWTKVYTLNDLLAILRTIGDATYKLVAGNTARGVYRSYGGAVDRYIEITSVPELTTNQIVGTNFILGANTTLTNAIDVFTQTASANPQFSYLQQLADHVKLVANVPVRNVGTLAGNLIMKHDNPDFASDVFVILEAVGATITVVGSDGQEVLLSPSDFLSFNLNLQVVVNISFPSLVADSVKYVNYKIMPRAENAHAHVIGGFLFQFGTAGTVEAASIVYGNINPDFIHATVTEQLLVGKNLFDNDTLQQAYASLSSELVPDVIPPDPTPEFRKQLAISLFYKAVLSIAPADSVSPVNQSGGSILERPISTGLQDYQTNESLYPLTQAIPKIEALAQTSGQAEFIHDMPDMPHQLYAQLILVRATPNSTLIGVDATQALGVEGIVAYYGPEDIPGSNIFLPGGGEELFCTGRVQYSGQPVGVLVGENQTVLRTAANLIQISVDPSAVAPLLSVRDVLASDRTDRVLELQVVTPSRRGTDIQQVVQGTFDIYQQYHFHMETQACNVIPNENGLDIYPSTQYIDAIQSAVASLLQIQANKINVSVRRLGGAFGAKITRNGIVSCAAALAAWKLRRPVKISLSLGDNMAAIGKRFPLSTDYEVGLNNEGVVQYLTATNYSDVGHTTNENPSGGVLESFRATYLNDTYEVHMDAVITDTQKHTWCRAPGSTEGYASMEAIMEHSAVAIGVDPLDFRVANLPADSPLSRYIDDFKTWADIDQRKQDIVTFNQENRWKKRGIAVTPMTYLFGGGGKFTTMVSIFHSDGSVQISHGGIEMGQGVNTKAAQVCAYKLGLPLEMVAVIPTNSFINPNNSNSGGSVTSEAICYGVIQACDQLIARLQPYMDNRPDGTWQQWVQAASNASVVLSATGLYAGNQPGVQGYPIYGVTATEVLLDVLTGQHLITRVDILEDIGQSMSPNVDIGQVEGAYVMGLGYYTTEKIMYDENGQILTDSTWNYYPPGPRDIPIDFRIRFPADNPNPVGVLQSKAIAEPPLLMSISVPLAIRNAVASARLDADPDATKWYPIAGTTDVENIYTNSLNNYSQYVL